MRGCTPCWQLGFFFDFGKGGALIVVGSGKGFSPVSGPARDSEGSLLIGQLTWKWVLCELSTSCLDFVNFW
jgi:hypothetical protein